MAAPLTDQAIATIKELRRVIETGETLAVSGDGSQLDGNGHRP